MSNLSTKIYRLAQLGVSYKLGLSKPLGPPYQYAVESTNRCNFKCAFCPQSNPDHGDTRDTGYLTVDNFRLFLERVAAVRGGNPNVSICLDGEPLMNRQFPEFIRIANEAGFFPRFSSNGKLLTPEVVDALAPYGFLAAVDFSSEREVFERYRGRRGDFDVVLANLRHLVEMARKNPRVKAEIVDITHYSGETDAGDSLARMRGMFPADLPSNIRFWTRRFHNFGGHLGVQGDGKVPGYRRCPYPWSSFNVAWNGDVVACCRDTEGKTVLGNVFEQSIPEVWWGARYQAFRRAIVAARVTDIAACAQCDMPYSGASDRWQIRYVLSSLLRR